MGCLLFLLFLVVPIAELYVIIQVGQEIGALATIVLLLVISILGAALVRREGARTWAALRTSMAAGRLPTREVTDGIIVMLGGALLLAPGFLTDIVGLFFVFPLTRPLVRKVLGAFIARRLLIVPPVVRRRSSYNGEVIEGEVVDEGPSETDRPDQIGRAG